MKKTMQILLLLGIACCAVCSVQYAVTLYRSRYVPRYLNSNAG